MIIDYTTTAKEIADGLIKHFKPNASFVLEWKENWCVLNLEPAWYNKDYHETTIAIKTVELLLQKDDNKKLKEVLYILKSHRNSQTFIRVEQNNIHVLESLLEETLQQHGIEIEKIEIVITLGKNFDIAVVTKNPSKTLLTKFGEKEQDIFSAKWDFYHSGSDGVIRGLSLTDIISRIKNECVIDQINGYTK